MTSNTLTPELLHKMDANYFLGRIIDGTIC